jgi:hypothetical protein
VAHDGANRRSLSKNVMEVIDGLAVLDGIPQRDSETNMASIGSSKWWQ